MKITIALMTCLMLFLNGLLSCEAPNMSRNVFAKEKDDDSSCEQFRLLSDFKRPQVRGNQLDETEFQENWRKIVQSGPALLEVLFNLQSDTNSSIVCEGQSYHIGFSDPNSSYWQNIGGVSKLSIQICSLHLICALYEDDYYFSSNRELYFMHDIERFKADPRNIEIFNNPLVVDSAWEYLSQWYSKCQGKEWPEIRNNFSPPLKDSGIFWVGQPGCLVYPNYARNNSDRLLHRLRP